MKLWHDIFSKKGGIMPRKSPFEIVLTDEERDYLVSLSRKYTAPFRDVVRARVILSAAEGMENEEIGEKLNLPRKTVSKWRKRFFYEREQGLVDKPRAGCPFFFSR
jgi:CRP-like cAMP-binding protein